jgi:hypothetical protein
MSFKYRESYTPPAIRIRVNNYLVLSSRIPCGLPNYRCGGPKLYAGLFLDGRANTSKPGINQLIFAQVERARGCSFDNFAW